MNREDVFALMDRFERSTLQSIKLSDGAFSIELNRGASAPSAASAPGRAAEAEPELPPEGPVIAAPLVGTFYAAPAPDQPPFVKAGDQVEKGQTVCLLEAMKMLSEVPAPCRCVIEEVLKDSGELASFGEPLFRYRPC